MLIADWFNFLLQFGNSVEPYVTFAIFSIWLSYMAKKEDHLLSYVSFLESVSGFLLVMIAISLYQVNLNIPNIILFYTFVSYAGVLWGVQGLIWGLVFYVTPVEQVLKIEKRKRGKKLSYF